ncbi:hypothetical protein JCM5353_007945 [Sporobolomyces roseus]
MRFFLFAFVAIGLASSVFAEELSFDSTLSADGDILTVDTDLSANLLVKRVPDPRVITVKLPLGLGTVKVNTPKTTFKLPFGAGTIKINPPKLPNLPKFPPIRIFPRPPPRPIFPPPRPPVFCIRAPCPGQFKPPVNVKPIFTPPFFNPFKPPKLSPISVKPVSPVPPTVPKPVPPPVVPPPDLRPPGTINILPIPNVPPVSPPSKPAVPAVPAPVPPVAVKPPLVINLPRPVSPPSKRSLSECSNGKIACPVPGLLHGFDCVDIRTDLRQCGDCRVLGGVDCSQLPGTARVDCIKGFCHVDSCLDGYLYDFRKRSCVQAPRFGFQ